MVKSTTHSDEKFSKLKTVVKRTFRSNRYLKNMQSDWIKVKRKKGILFLTKVTWDDP